MILLVFWWIFDMIEGEEENDVAEGRKCERQPWERIWDVKCILRSSCDTNWKYFFLFSFSHHSDTLPTIAWIESKLGSMWRNISRLNKKNSHLLTQCCDDDLIASYRRYVNVLRARTMLKMLNDTKIFILNFTFNAKQRQTTTFYPTILLTHSLVDNSISSDSHHTSYIEESSWEWMKWRVDFVQNVKNGKVSYRSPSIFTLSTAVPCTPVEKTKKLL